MSDLTSLNLDKEPPKPKSNWWLWMLLAGVPIAAIVAVLMESGIEGLGTATGKALAVIAVGAVVKLIFEVASRLFRWIDRKTDRWFD